MLSLNMPVPEVEEDRVIYQAFQILYKRVNAEPVSLSSPGEVSQFLTLAYSNEDREVFSALWLDCKNHLIAFEPLFFGTLTQTSVYPREVVRSAMKHNAAAVIIAHNHPSGNLEPSCADRVLTNTLKEALSLVECRVLDHMVIANTASTSFAERGFL